MMSWKDKFPTENRYFETEEGVLYCGHILDVLKAMPSESIDLIVTSPPYWGLRDYGEAACTVWDGDPNCEHKWIVGVAKHDNLRPSKVSVKTIVGSNKELTFRTGDKVENAFCVKCNAWYGQLGLEPTLELYLEHLLQITAELKRILKPTGVMFWNHGDNYSTSPPGNTRVNYDEWAEKGDGLIGRLAKRNAYGAAVIKTSIAQKCMCLQNYRLILHMIDEQGWILRNIIVWHKPNHMPSSVKDRFTNAYEPVFMLVKNKRYWFDLDAIRVPHKTEPNWIRPRMGQGEQTKYNQKRRGLKSGNPNIGQQQYHSENIDYSPLGKNPGDLWVIPTQPFPEAHFACADEHTEILSKEGWKKWNEVTMDDEIATFDILDETIHYHKPYAIYKYNYGGELVVIENQWVAQYVTPNHRVLLKYVYSAKRKEPDNFWHYVRADAIRPYSGILIPLSGRYEGELDVGSTEKAELLGWILTEGCLSGLRKGKGITIYQSYDANPDKVKRIEELLQKCKIDYKRIDRKRKRSIIKGKEYIRHEVCLYIKKRGKNWQWILDWINEDKTPKWKLLHLKHEQLEALYRGIILGDGHHRKDGRESLTQKSDYVREWFRTLCIHLGKRTTEFNNPRLRSAGTVFVTQKNYAQIHQSDFYECVRKVKYKGVVWCPHLPNTNFVARRKGEDGKFRYFITGNTFPPRLVEPMVKAGCPQWICKKCGKARKRIVEIKKVVRPRKNPVTMPCPERGRSPNDYAGIRVKTIGWTDCGCNAGWETGIVLDPFIGSGTTAVVAANLNRRWIGIEINPEYCEMAKRRILRETKQRRLPIA